MLGCARAQSEGGDKRHRYLVASFSPNISVDICWYTANIVNISVFDALSIGGGGPVAAVLLCMKREPL